MKCRPCILFLIIPGIAFANDPGDSALGFLEKVRKGELNLEPGGDTAIQPNTAQGKREAIGRSIERLRANLGIGELEIGEVNEDAEFAAVIVRKPAGFDASDLGVYPVALVKSGNQWLPAPVLASFENAVEGYTLPISERLARLEDWMMKERVADLGKLIAESSQRTRERIGKSLSPADLQGDDLAKITDLFLKKCAQRERAAILGFLGGLGKELPEDWSARLAASRFAVEAKGAWRLLVAPEILRIPVHSEMAGGREGMVSIACLDPVGSNPIEAKFRAKIRMLHIEATRDESGGWRLDLPAVLMNGEDFAEDADDLDQDLIMRFPEKLRKLVPLVRAETARAALDGVMKGLKFPSLNEILRHADYGKGAQEGLIACQSAAALWWSINQPGALHLPLEMGFWEEGDVAVAAFQWFSVNDPDRFGLVTLCFKKSPEGWTWNPGIDPGELGKTFEWWMKVNKPGWLLSWRKELVKKGLPLDKIDFGRTATDAEVSEFFSKWTAALAGKDLRAVFSMSAWLGDANKIPFKAMRNLSYDVSNFRPDGWELSEILRSESWVVAVVRQSLDADKVRKAFVPLVRTAAGVRILPEIDLFAEDGRTRDFLNESSFDRLEKSSDKQKIDELRKLFDEFKKRSGNSE